MRPAVFEGQTIGMLLGFGFKRRVYLYNMGFNPAFRTLSPGIVTIGLDIHSAIDDGFQYYDFLRGDEDYKFRLGAKSRYTVRLTT
jgi:CelD/BcsL family acetyltransferase involved in cellulose biosynthesis